MKLFYLLALLSLCLASVSPVFSDPAIQSDLENPVVKSPPPKKASTPTKKLNSKSKDKAAKASKKTAKSEKKFNDTKSGGGKKRTNTKKTSSKSVSKVKKTTSKKTSTSKGITQKASKPLSKANKPKLPPPNRPHTWQPIDASEDSLDYQVNNPIAEGDITAYGEDVIPDSDISREDEYNNQAERYKQARMAFLFGQYDQALKIWDPLAIEGYAKAQATLAWMYHIGKGVKKDYHRAFYWYQRAANQAHPIALNNLGVFYEQGLGIRKNLKKAAANYRDAAEWGYPFAQYNLGILYRNGRGVKKNKKEAIFWLQVAALQGVVQARDALIALGQKVDIPEHEPLKAKPKSDQLKWHRRAKPKSDRQIQRSTSAKNKVKSTKQSKSNGEPKHRASTQAKQKNKSVSTNTKSSKSRVESPTKKVKSSQKRTDKKPLATDYKKNITIPKESTKVRGKSPGEESGKNDPNNSSLPILPAMSLDTSRSRNNANRAVIPHESKHKNLLTANWVKKQDPNRYTLQLAYSDDLNKLRKLAEFTQSNISVAYFSTRRNGKRWYSLIQGVYPTFDDAQKEIRRLPREFKHWVPWVRRMSDVQARISKQ